MMHLAFPTNPYMIGMQAALLFSGALVVFLVLFTTRDIILRSDSFLFQVLCITLVAGLPLLGFLLYLLFRPSTTLSERALRHDISVLLARPQHQSVQQKKPEKQQKKSPSPSSHSA